MHGLLVVSTSLQFLLVPFRADPLCSNLRTNVLTLTKPCNECVVLTVSVEYKKAFRHRLSPHGDFFMPA